MRHLQLLSVLCLAACSDNNDGDDDDDDGLDAEVAASTYVPAVAVVSFEGDGEGFVEYGAGGAFDHTTPSTTGSAHDIAVIGMPAGSTYDWRAVLVGGDGVRHESDPGTFAVPPTPVALTPVDVDEALSTGTFDGWMMMSVIALGNASWLGFFDAQGQWVWWVESPGKGIISAEFGNDGKSVVFGEFGMPDTLDTGHIVRVSMDGMTRTETRVIRGHHDFVEHDETGEFAFVSFEARDNEVEGEGTFLVGTDTIRRGAEGMTDTDDPPTVFSTWDYADASDADDVEPAFTCAHVSAAKQETKYGIPNVIEWTHGNSLVYLPAQNAYYLLARYSDWLLKIDATTGVVDWQINGWGTYAGDFTRENGTLWSHPHLSDLWDGGALVFDNGDRYDPSPEEEGDSRVVQVSWDETARSVRQDFAIDRPQGGHAAAIGDARRLPDDRIVTAWGDLSDVTIHSAAGAALEWFGTISSGQYAARIRYTDDLYLLPDDG
jgi:hypothetical protein